MSGRDSRSAGFSAATVAIGRPLVSGSALYWFLDWFLDWSLDWSLVASDISGVFGRSEAAATGIDDAGTAETAAKASASPAPNWSSGPGGPRSRAVFVKTARTSSGFSAGLRCKTSAASPLIKAEENEV